MRIVSTTYHFDREKAIDAYNRQLEEREAIERNLAREKSILRESYISNQRRRLLP